MMFGFFDVSVPTNVTSMDLMMPKKTQQRPATTGAGL